MSYAWLVRIGKWVARKETFERMVAPAIADMQVEASFGSLRRWKHYLGIAVVLIHALLRDLRLDITSACDTEARRLAWKRAAGWYAGFAVLMTLLGLRYNLPPRLPLGGIWPAAITSTGLEAIIAAVMPGTTAAVLYLCRRSSSRRGIVLVTLTIAALTTAFALTVRPIRMAADRTLYDSIQTRISPAPNQYYKEEDDLNLQVTRWEDIQSGVWVLPHALIGVVLARRRGWRVASVMAAILATWVLVIALLRSLGSFPPSSLTMQRWRDIALVGFVALVWLTADELWRRLRQLAASAPQ